MAEQKCAIFVQVVGAPFVVAEKIGVLVLEVVLGNKILHLPVELAKIIVRLYLEKSLDNDWSLFFRLVKTGFVPC